jgi:Uma2 family endonuclease
MEIGQRLYTVEEFEAIADAPENRERLLELINGEIIEKVPTFEHGLIAGNIYGNIWLYVQQTGTGWVVMEVRYRSPQDKRNAYIPDVAYMAEAPDENQMKQGSVLGMPDLAVEVKSPHDSLKEMREKARSYLDKGSRMVWLVLPDQQIVEVYTATEEAILKIEDTLKGGDVLPGFSMPVADVFKLPSRKG